mmetsp:Transcript_75436/g.221190  ORF Transcript_75436/g.221190 Transcript_75436/m.221190 type:complete len:179 (-) Transcript_75436:196-732(-)
MGAAFSETCKPGCNPMHGLGQEDEVIGMRLPMAMSFGADLDFEEDRPVDSGAEHMLMSNVHVQPAEPSEPSALRSFAGASPPGPPGLGAMQEATHQTAGCNVLVYGGGLEDTDTASDFSGARSDEERRQEFEEFRQNVLARGYDSGLTIPPDTHPVIDCKRKLCAGRSESHQVRHPAF